MWQIGPQLEIILAAFPHFLLYLDLFSLFLVLFLPVLEETPLLSLFLSFVVFYVLKEEEEEEEEEESVKGLICFILKISKKDGLV
jgi:cytochrome b561